jgi:hypothetical protein
MMTTNLICSSCGQIHALDDMELTFARPEPIDQIPEAERADKVNQNKDLASIGYDRFFVRALLPLPVLDRGKPYNLGVWAEVTEEAFFRIRDLWDEPEQDKEPPFQATLQNRIPHLPETCGLSVQLHLTGPKTRPRLTVPSSHHPLHAQQCSGITSHIANQYTQGYGAQV